jgi:ribosomal protein S18 acetylase RimI-like enzyme
MAHDQAWTVVDLDVPRHAAALARLDTSFTTDRRYEARREGDALLLAPSPLDAPRTKRFPLDLVVDDDLDGIVALLDGGARGLIATTYEAWNRRLTIRHFYVDRPVRGRGAGRRLLDAALARGRGQGAITAWVETSDLNAPGIAAYRRLGFEVCGFDASLYRGTAAEDELAVFLARPLDDVTASAG